MTTDEAIYTLKNTAFLLPSRGGSIDEVDEAIDMAIKALEGQQWIPCSERLPEDKNSRYWICTDGGYQCQCRWTNDIFGIGETDRWGWSIFDIPQYSKVIAWMPLPEPYKESSDD